MFIYFFFHVLVICAIVLLLSIYYCGIDTGRMNIFYFIFLRGYARTRTLEVQRNNIYTVPHIYIMVRTSLWPKIMFQSEKLCLLGPRRPEKGFGVSGKTSPDAATAVCTREDIKISHYFVVFGAFFTHII